MYSCSPPPEVSSCRTKKKKKKKKQLLSPSSDKSTSSGESEHHKDKQRNILHSHVAEVCSPQEELNENGLSEARGSPPGW